MRRRLRKPIGAQVEQQETRRIRQRKQAIDPVAQGPGRPADGQQRADRQSVKGLVKKNHQKGSESEQEVRVPHASVKFYAGGECDAIQ